MDTDETDGRYCRPVALADVIAAVLAKAAIYGAQPDAERDGGLGPCDAGRKTPALASAGD